MKTCFICGARVVNEKWAIGTYPLYECPECGFLFLHPVPDDSKLASIYRDYYHSWHRDASLAEVEDIKRKTFAGYLDRVSRYVAGGCLLDIGCAKGELMEEARQRGFDVYGVEVSPEGIAETQRKFGADKVVGRILRKGDFPSHFFDVISLCDVIEHFSHPLHLLAILRDILKPSGVLILVTPDASSWTRKLTGKRWPHYKTEHPCYYNRHNIARLLADLFEIKAILPAKKTLTINYLLGIIAAYSQTGLAKHAVLFLKRLPRFVRIRHFKAHIGEMFIVCRKRDFPVIAKKKNDVQNGV